MNWKHPSFINCVAPFVFLTGLLGGCNSSPAPEPETNETRPVVAGAPLVYIVDPVKSDLRFYWKDRGGERFANFSNLREAVSARGDSLVFAVNGGMFNKAHQPQGLYVETGKTLAPLDTVSEGYGNFYLQPNGIFGLLTDGTPLISATDSLAKMPGFRYATQSGPMLVIDGHLHPAFNEGSDNLNVRNGVGLLPDGRLLFAMSTEKVNFYDFATFFRQRGCEQALYLDGYISKTWLPEREWRQSKGNLGVIIAVTSPK